MSLTIKAYLNAIRLPTRPSKSFIFFKGSEFSGSNNFLIPNAERILKSHNYRDHKAIFLKPTSCYNHLMTATIHQVNRGPAQGGLRYSNYETMDELLDDGIRLSLGMSQKSALANLWWGGGKGIITKNEKFDSDPIHKKRIFNEYGTFVSELNGCYYTAEDVGTSTEDMNNVFEKTRYVTCISPELGGSGNPSSYTALGVVSAIIQMTKILQSKGKMPQDKDLTIGIQGLGNCGSCVLYELISRMKFKRIHATDISPDVVERVQNKVNDLMKTYSGEKPIIEIVVQKPKEKLNPGNHILVPCALGGVITKEFVLSTDDVSNGTRMICGSANNQLESDQVAQLLHDRGILYCPDFIVNRMGIVNCANEMYGKLKDDLLISSHYDPKEQYSIPRILGQIYTDSETNDKNMLDSAKILADKMIKMNHPIMGDRFNKIVDSNYNLTDW